MSHEDSSTVAKLIDAINENRLTGEDIERRLIAYIDAEYEKGDQANIRLICACEKLLNEISSNPATFVSHKEVYYQALKKAMAAKNQKNRRMYRYSLPKAVSAAVLTLVLLFGGVVSVQWMEGQSTKDEQQYTIQGYEISLSAIQSCIAEKAGLERISSTNWEEIVAYLGFEPKMPTTFLPDWAVTEYAVFVTQDTVNLTATYVRNGISQDTLLYDLTFFSTMENAYMMFEQNKSGKHIPMGTVDIYMSENVARSTFSWHNANEVCLLSGNISEKDGIALIDKLMGGS